MKVDLHLHLCPYSSCSIFKVAELNAAMRDNNLNVIGVTDHETIKGWQKLRQQHTYNVLTDLEVATELGDFLVYSTDKEYLKTLTFDDRDEESLIIIPKSFEDIQKRDDSLVIWPHPNLVKAKDEDVRKQIMDKIDAVEIFNGNIMSCMLNGTNYYGNGRLDKMYLKCLRELAALYGKPLVGGSDSHRPEHFLRCWTQFDNDITNTEEMMVEVKAGRVKPCVREGFEFLADVL